MRGLRDKVAIVTGAASPIGIGFATAKRLAEEGALVALTDLNHAGVEERAAELRQAGYRAIGIAHDAVDEASWETVLQTTRDELGPLDILVNNAAIAIQAHVVDMELSDWRRQLDVNGTTAFLGCRIATREWQSSGRTGAIVNVASTASLVAGEYGGAYCASKGAVLMLTKVVAIENAKHGIRVNSVHPGWTKTAMLGDSLDDPEAQTAQIKAIIPAGRLGDPSEMAAAIAFLASDDASFCNGTSLLVDGGLTAQ
ncbi:SDR family oxidoreductase [Sphingobium sp. AN558]|uniref:SDR family NAD(P)-dependent oxidoreductase n=1 Tax=Sphingobium sp. AN558 TaxID=3133442 RepID=UPI0030BEB5D5